VDVSRNMCVVVIIVVPTGIYLDDDITNSVYDSLSIPKMTFLAKGIFQEMCVVVIIVVPTGIYLDDDDITNIVS